MTVMRPAVRQDAAALAKLCAACVHQPWSELSFLSEMDKGSLVLTVWEDERLVGFAVTEMLDEVAYLHLIGVDTDYRRKGLGKQMLTECEVQSASRGAERMMLEVRESNQKAREFYLSLGYEILARRRDFYSFPREDGLTMQKVITDENTCN